MFLINENNRKISGACRYFVLCLDCVDISPFIYFNSLGVLWNMRPIFKTEMLIISQRLRVKLCLAKQLVIGKRYV